MELEARPAVSRHPEEAARIKWISDRLPSLPATIRLGIAADAVFLGAVWMHVRRQIPLKPGFFALRTNSCDQGDMAAYFSQLSFWGDSINNSWTTRTIRRRPRQRC
jgi:hypothetical protein